MRKVQFIFICGSLLLSFFLVQCAKDSPSNNNSAASYPNVLAAFGSSIDLNNLVDYAGQAKPSYIVKDNTGSNGITNAKATLGRVLFYDKRLSIDSTVACASCHIQQFAFSDTAIASRGVASGLTGRHSMRLVNSRFAVETKFFWDERAATLEAQTTKPIQDHAEMGFSGQSGRPGLNDLLTRLANLGYYNELFQFVYGDKAVTEARLQECLAQFIRSIQSFDSKYDAGRAQVTNDNVDFPNFTAQENQGKNLFLSPPVFDATSTRTSGGAGCSGCHGAPEFDIAPNSGNNGIIGSLAGGQDQTNTRAPSLRDLANISGTPNGPMMHTGVITTLQAAIGHYGNINANPNNARLDPKLKPNGIGQKLNFNAQEVNALIAFLKTLTGKNIYTDSKWSNPFK
jgi:cytochrome c peroxidase